MLFRCDILAAEDMVDVVSGMLAMRVSSGWEEQSLPDGRVCFVVHAHDVLFIQGLTKELHVLHPSLDIVVSSVTEQDWQQVWREYFTPVACGECFLVLPPWRERDTLLGGRLPIIIEPRSAFGTGHHASTVLCLEAISELYQAGCVAEGMSFLDLGTGSGILGIGCCRLGLRGIGLDTDPLAVENALENKERNNCRKFRLAMGSMECVKRRHFDLVLANILAGPLRELAPDIGRAVKKNGCLVLSGILTTQADEVEASYRHEGFSAARRKQAGEWTALIWDGAM
ncbi:MAG: 50S ribosomal protein L11 methyltransferase [Betaproteobacteria bacterium]|nr:50S ribosomal protein L11 methyltransferase [Betaproteobacteria bacterium]